VDLCPFGDEPVLCTSLDTGTVCPVNLDHKRAYGYVVLVALAGLIGFEAHELEPVAIALVTLAPLASHARHVGLRHMLTEPSSATIIVWFYIAVFPLRALVIAASGYDDVYLARGVVPSNSLVAELLLASFATTALIEAYYFVLGPLKPQPIAKDQLPLPPAVVRFAFLLSGLALVSLVGVIATYGGIGAAHAALLQHSVAATLQGKTSLSESAFELFAAPSVWAASYVAINRQAAKHIRVTLGAAAGLVILGALIVYGSRLNALLGLMGVWVVLYYSGRRLSTGRVLAALVVAVLVSQPILSERAGGIKARESTLEKYSRIVGYGELDVALAIRQEPDTIRQKFDDPNRWLELPEYFVPSFIWHNRPILFANRLGLYVGEELGNVNDATIGLPSTYVTEGWLLGGWIPTLIISLVFGAFLGWGRKRLVSSPTPSAAAVLTYCFMVTLGWTYYKDGDLVPTIVGQTRTAVYLGLLLLVTGVIGVRARRPKPIYNPQPARVTS